MSNINVFIRNVESSRKRTGVLYCPGSFNSVIEVFKENIHDIKLLDCTVLFKRTLTFSASELLNQIENESKESTTIVLNIETFIVSNSHNFSDQLAKILIIREPIKPLFFLFYSKKNFRQFKEHFEVKELNSQNILEL